MELSTSLLYNSSSIFSEVRSPDVMDNDKSMALLYSDSSIYAKGHNVGVNWEDNSSVWTEFLPSFEVPVMKADSSLDDLIPTMDEFSNPETVVVALNKMKQFMKRYREWSASESIRFSDYDPSLFDHYEDIFDKHMGHVDNTISRISDGIEYLKDNEIAREAFVLRIKQSIFHKPTVGLLTHTELIISNGDLSRYASSY